MVDDTSKNRSGDGLQTVDRPVKHIHSAVVDQVQQIRVRGRYDQIVKAVGVEVGQQEGPLRFVFFSLHGLGWNRVNTPRVLSVQGTDQVEFKRRSYLRCGDDLFDGVGIQIHTERINEVAVSFQNPNVFFRSIHTHKHDFIGVGTRIQDMRRAVVVHGKFEVFTNRSRIQDRGHPKRTREVHLMQNPICRSHQSPFHALRRDFKFQVRGVNILENGSGVPLWSVPIGCTLPCITANFQIITVGIEHSRQLVGRDGNRTVNQGRCVCRCNRVNERRAPIPVWSVEGGSYGSFLGAPAVMLVVMERQFHVRRPVVFNAGVVQFQRVPVVKHRLFTDNCADQAINADGGSGQIMPVP